MAVPITQCFVQKLPEFPSTFQGDYRIISSSTTSTRNEDPVSALFVDGAAILIGMARQLIDRVQPHGPISYVPMVEKTHRLGSEADVLRAVVLYLLHPVNMLLSAGLPQGYQIYCQGEVTAVRSRFDIQWTLKYDNTEVTMAILELKNTKVVHYQDFAPAFATPENAATMLEDAMDIESGTFLTGNAYWLSKQARKYADTCDNIAVFDWNAMFIFDFSDVQEDSRVPRLVKGIYFDESNATTRREGDGTFRLVLLGFLMRAFLRVRSTLA
ncbi:hypothetical protein Plec18170_005613 [Paecilomyces lecythidis]